MSSDNLAALVRGQLQQCFELSAQTIEVIGDTCQGDACQVKAERLADAYCAAVAKIRRDIHAAIDALPDTESTPADSEWPHYKERLVTECEGQQDELAAQIKEEYPGFLEMVELLSTRQGDRAGKDEEPITVG